MKLYVLKNAMMMMAMMMAAQAGASTMMQLSDEEIIKRGQYMVSGKVESIYNAMEKGNTPFQYVTVEIEKVYKNDEEKPLYEGDRIVLRQMGGTANGVTLEVDGMPRFVEGSQVMISLKMDKNGYYYVVGNSQGLYKMVNDKLIKDTQSEGTMFVRQGENGEMRFEPGRVTEMGMEQMKAKIARTMEQAQE